MKISLDWLSDFVDLSGLAPEEIAHRLTMATAETEGIERIHRHVAGVLIGEVVEIDRKTAVPMAIVDCGGKRFMTFCSAPNLRMGLKAPLATAGAELAGGQVVQPVEFEGRKSEAVLCSAKELGFSDWHEIVLECPPETANGTPLADLVPAEDVLLEIDNKSLTHRPDLWGHYGFARELAALFGRPLRAYPGENLSAYDHLPAIPVSIEDLDGCPCYTCIRVRFETNRPSPLVVQRRLHALGQRTYGLSVDLTNYVMFEIAQPTHAFDGAKVQAIRVATMGKPGTFVPIDGLAREMVPEDLLIWNEHGPAAIAGVMGGKDTEVSEQTSELLLESANFRGSRIRRTALRLNLRTEASQRFEKGQPAAITKLAAARILGLVRESGSPLEVRSRFTVAGDLQDRYRTVVLPEGFLAARAGVEIPAEEATGILTSLGFQVGTPEQGVTQCGVPPYRSERDISLPEDIVEEVLRIYGYGRIPPTVPQSVVRPVPENVSLSLEHRARRTFTVGHNFTEVHTYAWYDTNWLAEIGYKASSPLELKNPSAAQNNLMRTHLLPNLLDVVQRNQKQRHDLRVVELGKVFWADANGASQEAKQIAGAAYERGSHKGQAGDLYLSVKGAIEDIFLANQMDVVFKKGREPSAPWEEGNSFADIFWGQRRIGRVGFLSERPRRIIAPNGQVAWFVLDFEDWGDTLYPPITYEPIPEYPASWHDFSVVWPVDRGYEELIAILDTFAHPLVNRREYLGYFQGKDLPAGHASYTFRYWLLQADRTLEAADIEGFRTSLVQFLQEKGIALR